MDIVKTQENRKGKTYNFLEGWLLFFSLGFKGGKGVIEEMKKWVGIKIKTDHAQTCNKPWLGSC